MWVMKNKVTMNIIKSIYKFTGVAVLAVALSSCGNDWLDVSPSDGTDADGALVSTNGVTAARVGLYKALKGDRSFVDYYGQQMFVYGDVHAGDDYQYNNIGGSNRGSFYYLMTYNSASEFGSSNVPWQSPYIVIGRANRIIEAVDGGGISDASENAELLAQYKAEALVMRALAHFDLVRIYGKPYTENQGASLGVPLVTTTLESSSKPARSTVKEVYDQVLKDLNSAISLNALPAAIDDANPAGYINKWGAKAILSRVYLNMGDYANALSTAEEVINNPDGFRLWTRDEYVGAWGPSVINESEFLFRFNVSSSVDNNDLVGIGNLQQVGGYAEMVATKSFVERLSADENDIRNDIFVDASASSQRTDVEVKTYGKNKVYLNKLRGVGGNSRTVPVVPVIRMSEVYLTAAECAFRTGDNAKAAEYLNDIIKNRTTTESRLVTASTVTLDGILMERRKELIGEGQRYFDALRCGETITRYTNDADKGWHATLSTEARSFGSDSFKAIAAIPQSEINANPQIEQNPGYSE